MNLIVELTEIALYFCTMAHKSLTKAIAKALQAGNICYVNRQTREITTIVDLPEGTKDTSERQAQLEKLEEKIKRYYKVPRMSPAEAIHIMHDFVDEDLAFANKKELTNALKRKNPSRNFLQILQHNEELHEYWLIFQAKWYQEWVRGYLLDIYRY